MCIVVQFDFLFISYMYLYDIIVKCDLVIHILDEKCPLTKNIYDCVSRVVTTYCVNCDVF